MTNIRYGIKLWILGSASSPLRGYYWLGERGGWSYHVSVRGGFRGQRETRRMFMSGIDRCLWRGGLWEGGRDGSRLEADTTLLHYIVIHCLHWSEWCIAAIHFTSTATSSDFVKHCTAVLCATRSLNKWQKYRSTMSKSSTKGVSFVNRFMYGFCFNMISRNKKCVAAKQRNVDINTSYTVVHSSFQSGIPIGKPSQQGIESTQF